MNCQFHATQCVPLRIVFTCAAICVLASSALGVDPKFQAQTIDDQIQIGYGLAIGRVDADPYVDIVLADKEDIVWYANPGTADKDWAKHVIARNLTAGDNVCLAVRDINGDGLVEIAVGANWNPGETSDTSKSGALFYLIRPDDPRAAWQPKALTPHDPTTHRMQWVKTPAGFRLAVLPLHGLGNKDGAGTNVDVSLYQVQGEPSLVARLDTQMHMTHNFELLANDPDEYDDLLVAGKEGFTKLLADGSHAKIVDTSISKGAGEVRRYPSKTGLAFVAIEPMHGTDVVLYQQKESASWQRVVIDTTLNQGHALAVGDLLGTGKSQVVAGWRGRDQHGKVGIRLYVPSDTGWDSYTVDKNQMACEDLKLVDLNRDGRLDIVGAGRATKNLVVYWNRSQ